MVIDDKRAEALYQELKENNMISHEFAGGTIGNTLHNYSTLADDKSILLGVMSRDITIGSYSYRYLCNTSSRMDLNYLQPVQGPIGRCYALISEEGERTFAISEGLMNQLKPESIPEHIFKNASALVLTAYLVRCKEGDPMPEATMKAIEFAKKHDVPVVMTMGTKYVIQNNPQWWREFLAEHVSVVAMNEEEAEALTGESDPLLAADKTLEWGKHYCKSVLFLLPHVDRTISMALYEFVKKNKNSCHFVLSTTKLLCHRIIFTGAVKILQPL